MTRLLLTLLFLPILCGADGRKVFNDHCAGCHGADARGSGKGPGLAGNPHLTGDSMEQLRSVIQRGFPASGMPAFDLPADEADAVASYVRSLNAGVPAEKVSAGKRIEWRQP